MHPAETSSGGRRRADDRPQGWQDRPPGWQGGPGGGEAPPPSGRRAAPEPDEGGAHTAGRSVTELLAAHAIEEPTRRHRRRAD